MELGNQSNAHAVENLKLHIVFVTKYRRKSLTPELPCRCRRHTACRRRTGMAFDILI
ncbi:hypothetical protein [Cupriavidus sp. DF5525]|uniref:hypothetical protein n=1 Tax=Cupriavidus sp. DF5525 TaxID=3160989 RepID=UPI0026AE192F